MSTPSNLPIFILLISLICLTLLPTLSTSTSTPQSPTQQQNLSPEQDKQIQRLSNFFIELINKYDNTGNGLIKKQIYPLFLRDVFIKGSFGDSDDKYQHIQLLLNATTQFTKTKDQKVDSISVQEFYDDIISRFTLFLMERKEYEVLVSTLFQDLEQNTKKSQKKQSESQGTQEEDVQKQQL